MARIELDGIQKRWGAVWGVRDVNIDIADEEFVIFLGPSGCGKTTTMRMIAGLEEPSGGEIRMDGEVMNEVEARDRDVAMVFQGYALYPNMTIYENIRFPLRMRGVPKPEQDRLVRRAAELVELGPYLDRKPSALSGGQRQRAALGRAIVREPQVFLMDEPLSNLDAKLRQAMRVQIKHLQRKLKITTVYVTHDQIEAMTLADRIVVMQGGAIQQIGTPDTIYSDPANTFVAGFIGAPPMNLIEGAVSGDVFRAAGIEVQGVGVEGDRAITLGVRPEDCHVTQGEAHLRGQVYGVEPTGEATFLTLKAGERLIEIKAARGYRSALDVGETVSFDRARLYFFDTATGQRIR
ncbi:MAG: ABC transporter ATP-binding protein [Rhodobacteraceae bacterium]|nr:ABC transporter ATP-binding protein [Paracoccaceae bacterium]